LEWGGEAYIVKKDPWRKGINDGGEIRVYGD
jgi:hypothetical protein